MEMSKSQAGGHPLKAGFYLTRSIARRGSMTARHGGVLVTLNTPEGFFFEEELSKMDAESGSQVEQQKLFKKGLELIKEALLMTMTLEAAEEGISLIKVTLRRRFPGSFFL